MRWYQTNKFKYALAGALFGFCFPVIAVSIDILRLGLSFSWQDIVYVQTNNPVQLIINTAPLFLGLFALVGGIKQDRIQRINLSLEQDIAHKKEKLSQTEKGLHETTQHKQRMENELAIANQIQQSMLPKTKPGLLHETNVDICAQLIPAREVGGDFYDFFFIDKQLLCFVVADVSGKGMPAALMMAMCKMLIKSTAQFKSSPADICAHVNNEIARDNPNFMFVSAFVGILNTQTQTLCYTNAGHCPTYIKTEKELIKLTDLHGVVLGAMEDIPYKESHIQLQKGDWVFAYTDGITEAHNSTGELFSDVRLAEALTKSTATNAQMLLREIVQQVQTFENSDSPFDDITALALRIT